MTLNEHLTNQDKLDKEQLEKLEALRDEVKNDVSSTYYYLDADNIMEALDNTEGAKGRISTLLIEIRSEELFRFMRVTSLSYWLAFVESKVLKG
jgi:hypothetical protein